jgi:hypothetical protein
MSVASPPPPPQILPTQQPASTQAIVSLILGILSFFCCPLLAPIAWFLANQELKAVQAGTSPVASEGIAKAGMIVGIIGTVYMGLVFLWFFFLGGMAVLSAFVNR